MYKRLFILLISMSIFQVLVGCSRQNKLLARIGNAKITVKDFKRKIERVPSYYQGFLATEGGKRQFLDGLVKEKLLIYQAEKEKIHQREDIKEQIKDAKEQIILEAMVEELKKDRIYVTDKEIEQYYEQHKEEYLHPEKVRASHILLKTEEEAKEILEKLKKGASFSKLARQHSMDVATAPNGGDIEYFEQGEMVPEFEKAVFALEKIGDITSVIKTQFGYHVAKLTGRKKMEAKSLEEASDEIRRILQKEKFDMVIEKYMEEHTVRAYYDYLKEEFLFGEDVGGEAIESEEEGDEGEKK